MDKDKKGKKSLVIAVVLVSLLALSCTSILAYLTATDERYNDWRIGYVDVVPEENFIPPSEIIPGVSFIKDVRAFNKGLNDAYVRFKVVFTDGDMEKLCDVDYNTEDYEYSEGYWYYKDVLEKDTVSESLFTTVTVSETASQDEIKDFDIIVYVEAYQSKGFATYQNAWEHFYGNKSR